MLPELSVQPVICLTAADRLTVRRMRCVAIYSQQMSSADIESSSHAGGVGGAGGAGGTAAGLSSNVLATRVLPSLIPLAVSPSLNIAQVTVQSAFW